MNHKHIGEIRTNEVLRKRLAKYIALHCFRNTNVLENLHSGNVPISKSGDYSDVKVVTPGGEIPWSDLSRFDDNEMKAMMIDVVNHCDQLLAILFSTTVGDKLIEKLRRRDLVPNSNDPEWRRQTDRERQVASDSRIKGPAAKRNMEKRETHKARGRRVGKK